jgi:hypothetical protein
MNPTLQKVLIALLAALILLAAFTLVSDPEGRAALVGVAGVLLGWIAPAPGASAKLPLLILCAGLALGSQSCSTTQQSPLGAYLQGVEDAVLESESEKLPDIYVDWRNDEGVLCACTRVEGEIVVYLYPARILRTASSVQHGRLLIAQVLAHELAHAKATCSDADHAVRP